MMKAREMMTKNLVTVKEDTPIREVAKLLYERKISGIPVVENGKIIGVVTEGDVLRKRIAPRIPDVLRVLGQDVSYEGMDNYHEAFRKMGANTAGEIMTREVRCVDVDDDIIKVGDIILNNNVKRVPVLDNGELVGIISRSDLVKLLL